VAVDAVITTGAFISWITNLPSSWAAAVELLDLAVQAAVTVAIALGKNGRVQLGKQGAKPAVPGFWPGTGDGCGQPEQLQVVLLQLFQESIAVWVLLGVQLLIAQDVKHSKQVTLKHLLGLFGVGAIKERLVEKQMAVQLSVIRVGLARKTAAGLALINDWRPESAVG